MAIKGNEPEAAKASALLKVMEVTAEQFRIAKTILQTAVLRLRLGTRTTHTEQATRARPRPTLLQPQLKFPCPHCGLMAECLNDDGSSTVVYDFSDWSRRCYHKHHGSPALCQR